jgi:nicotinate-nucleotide adenylyltransferase
VQRIGVFGGSFDPVHLGHLIAAQDAYEQLQLDRVVFMPAWQAPLREAGPRLDPEVRVELIRLAIADDSRFEVSTIEIDRGGVSYSVETALALRRQWPGERLFWIIGTDQAERLHGWHRIEELAGLVEFIVLARPGYAGLAGAAAPAVRLRTVAAHVFEVSSTEVRRRITEGKPVRFFLPSAVADRIERERLFR